MTSRTVLGRRTRAGAALTSALGALAVLAALSVASVPAAAATGPADAGTSVHVDDPFSFD